MCRKEENEYRFEFADTYGLDRISEVREKAIERFDRINEKFEIDSIDGLFYSGGTDTPCNFADIDFHYLRDTDCEIVGLVTGAKGTLGDANLRSYYFLVLLGDNICFEAIPTNSKLETGYKLYKNGEVLAVLKGMKEGRYAFDRKWVVYKAEDLWASIEFPSITSAAEIYQIECGDGKYPLRLGSCVNEAKRFLYFLEDALLLLLLLTFWPKWFNPLKHREKDFAFPQEAVCRNDEDKDICFVLNVVFRQLFSGFQTA